MAISEIPLSSAGLLNVAGVCERLQCSPKAVQNWINAGLIPVIIVGKAFLVREKDLKGFKRPPRGRPSFQS